MKEPKTLVEAIRYKRHEMAAMEQRIAGEIRLLSEKSIHRWEFWLAILGVALTMFYGTWSASQTAAQNGITVSQGMDQAADRAAERVRDGLIDELQRQERERERDNDRRH